MASLSVHKGFRRYVKANADTIGITGTIQRYTGDDVLLVFEGVPGAHLEFLNFLKIERDRGMIQTYEVLLETSSEYTNYYDNFTILKDFSRTEDCGGKTRRGVHSDEEYDKLSTYSADSPIIQQVR